jgi:DNA-binding transcriptional LysR family regulator
MRRCPSDWNPYEDHTPFEERDGSPITRSSDHPENSGLTRGVELRELRYFYVLSEELHFGKAAERLHISQPPLSQAIAQLERKLGTQLLDRTSRQVTLTRAGAVLSRHASRLLLEADDAIGATQRAAAGETGTLRLALGSLARFTILPQLQHLLATRFPNLGVEVTEEEGDAVVELVRSGGIDVGLLVCAPKAAGIESVPVRVEGAVAVIHQGHPLAAMESVTVAQLAKYPLLVWPRAQSRGSHDLVLSIFDAHPPAATKVVPMFGGGWWGDMEEGAFCVLPDGSPTIPEVVSLPMRNSSATFVTSLLWSSQTPPGMLPGLLEVVDSMSSSNGWL